MVKQRGYWVPVCWGWLPDKTDISYKVFFLLIMEALEKEGLKIDINSVTSDFELNIMKAIDGMLQVDIEGCFFHLKKVFQDKVSKKGMGTRYEKDKKFRNFVNDCASIAHLPIEDIETALEVIEEEYVFEDRKAEEFKAYFLKYIKDYWVNGCYPPSTWNCYERSQDTTNNNQVCASAMCFMCGKCLIKN
jgi:hypothetical protein